MKKLFLTMAVALGVFSAASAQGNMWVGGTAGVWSSKIKGSDSELSFKVMPEFGYILNSNVGLGIAIGGAHSNDVNTYIINPFVRYTCLKSDLGGLFVDGGVSYGWSKVTNGGTKSTNIGVGFTPGVAINVSNKVALIGKFGFLGFKNTKVGEGDAAVKRTGFGFDLDMNNIQLGMNLKF